MTETLPEQTEDWSDVEHDADSATYPEFPANPHNHRYTISMNGQGPMVVIRGNSADEINAAADELREKGVGAALGSFWSEFKAAALVANGMGGATPVPAGPPAPPQGAPTPPPFGPNVSVPAAPGYAGPPQAPMPPAPQAPQWGGQQQGGAQGNRGPQPRPTDWAQVFRIEVPFPQKDQFKTYREQNKDYFKGMIRWAGGGGYWVNGEVVQSLSNYNPMPA